MLLLTPSSTTGVRRYLDIFLHDDVTMLAKDRLESEVAAGIAVSRRDSVLAISASMKIIG